MNPEYYDNLINICQKTINNYRNLCRFILVAGAIIFLAGAVILAFSLLKASEVKESLVPSLPTLFGIITGAFSLLPYKEINPQELKIERYKAIKKEIEQVETLPFEEKMTKIKLIVDFYKSIES